MDPDFYNNLQNFGFATMAAGGQPGSTFLGAVGQGGLVMNQQANQRAQMQNMQQETIQRKLGNALALRQLNMGNTMLGLAPVQMDGIPNLMPQQQPSGISAGQPWSATPGMTTIKTMSPDNANKMAELHPDSAPTQPSPAPNGMYGYSQGALEVARGLRPPANLDEATQAASLLSVSGMNPERQKQLEALVEKNQEPQNIREGNQVYYPLGAGTVAASKNVNGYNDENIPTVQSYTPSLSINGVGQRNSGQGIQNQKNTQGNIQSGNGGQIRTGFSPEEKKTQENFFGPEATAYTNAVNAKGKLFTMQQDLDILNTNPDFLSTGAGGTGRIEFAKAINAGSQALFGGDFYNADKLAAGESLFKVTGNLGFDMSKQLGAREPGVITQQAIKLNPGMDNTPQGAQLIKNTLLETQQRTIDERAFKTKYYGENGYHQTKAELQFDKEYPPELYAKRATSLIKPIVVNTPAAAKGLLAGTKIQTPKGIKIIPQGVGIDPPTYQSIEPPQALPTDQPQGDDE